jgi:hypothetical protein
MVKHFSSDFDVGAFNAFTKAMIAPEENLFGKAMMNDKPLNGLQQVFISSGKAGTAQTYYYFPPVIHGYPNPIRKDKKEMIDWNHHPA